LGTSQDIFHAVEIMPQSMDKATTSRAT